MYTKLYAYPKTGRTHQIRVHLAALKHPVLSDSIYMTNKQFDESINHFPRLMLHAQEIRFEHPKIKEKMEFTAGIPKEFGSKD